MKSISFASGKGGVGKTLIAANLAIWLALEGQKVLIVDADLGLANLDIALGLEPGKTLKHVLRGSSLSDAVTEGPAGIHLLAGGSGVNELAGMRTEDAEELIRDINEFAADYDFLIYDVAAGIHPIVMAFLANTDETCIVCTPEPSSLLDSYATIKQLGAIRDEVAASVIVNVCDNPRHGVMVYERLRMITGQYLSVDLRFAGAIASDPDMVASARQRQPVLLAHPAARCSRELEEAASQLFFRKSVERKELSLLEKLKSTWGPQKAA